MKNFNEPNRCETCGEGATWRIDPFDKEIHGEINWRWLCDDHYQARADDI
jgi:hypothetical protein